jgi:hypothetical protein
MQCCVSLFEQVLKGIQAEASAKRWQLAHYDSHKIDVCEDKAYVVVCCERAPEDAVRSRNPEMGGTTCLKVHWRKYLCQLVANSAFDRPCR